ncbi:hypothetical protein T265_00792 [Opisthorchis viverrini]|uniref:Uncharacterized protein n=1 Tax=Opisthorchis viverrini TaxID=6198 RepID=A0A075ABS1_OPIVI|nr:hypothetical protein T265_00792 [Opisthorchis viverrini]KER33290.1 hypothetical protein T265_00792 [Opisthorchis viverrini]
MSYLNPGYDKYTHLYINFVFMRYSIESLLSVSVCTTFESSNYVMSRPVNVYTTENSSTAHDPFHPSTSGPLGGHSPKVSINHMCYSNPKCTKLN